MVKTRKRSVSLLVALAFVLTLVLPVGAALGATDSIKALSAPTYSDDPADQPQTLGRIRVVIPAGSVVGGDVVNFSITPGFHFDKDADGDADDEFTETVYDTVQSAVYNYIYVPATYGGEENGLVAADLEVDDGVGGPYEVQIRAKNDQKLDYDAVFYIYFNAIYVDEGTTGDCTVTFDAPTGSGFPTGSVVIGTGVEAGDVELSASGLDTANDSFTFTLRIKETKAGSLSEKDPSIVLTLPDGYEWGTAPDDSDVVVLWGDDPNFTFDVDEEVLKINIDEDTSTQSAWDIPLAFSVSDESKVEAGDIMAAVSGKSSTTVDELKVGTYGEFGASIAVDGDVPTILAGRDAQEIADIKISESLAASLVEGRTITLTLPEGAAWQPVYEDEDSPADLDDFTTKNSLDINFSNYGGTGSRTARFTVDNSSSKAGTTVYLRDVQVALDAGFSGDLTLKVGGSAGLSGELVVAKVVAPVKASASATPEVVIGTTGQAAGDVTLTESAAGALIEDEIVELALPSGVEFDGTPTVSVTSGDLKIASVKKKDAQTLTFTVTRESSTPSTILVSGIKLKLYRTPPEGTVELKVGGKALVETSGYDDWAARLKSVAIATAVTAEAKSVKAVLTVGSTTMTVNGEAVTMDVAPYIDTATNRTYVPVRYVAQALGVTADNIYFSNGVVTLLKDSRAVQMTIGSKTLVVNGVAVSMDAAPVIVSGRTMLPFRWVATALGASVSWDEAAKSVTVEL